MAIETNAKRIVKVMKGDTQIWADTDTWVELKLGTGMTGNVVFKNNGDGTGLLAGALNILSLANSQYLVLYPPTGVQFVSVNWTKPNMWEGRGKGDGTNYGSTDRPTFEIKNGNLYVNIPRLGAADDGTLIFNEWEMNSAPDTKNICSAVSINIKSV